MKAARGFTLIELMVTIAIIAIVSTIGLALFTQAQKTARDGKRISDLNEIQTALEQYYNVNNGYPSLGTANASSNVSSLSVLNGYFANNIPPSDPQISEVSSYQYTYYSCGGPSPTLATQYIICARPANPAGKATMDSVPANGCATVGSSGTTYICKKSLSN